MANYEKQRDLILLGAYQYGTDPKTDYAIDKIEEVESFLKQNVHECDDFETTVNKLVAMFADAQ
jgi:type III secretion protein N (ATPase)